MPASPFAMAKTLGMKVNGGSEMIGAVRSVIVRLMLDLDGASWIAAEVPAQNFDESLVLGEVRRLGGPVLDLLVGMSLHQGWLGVHRTTHVSEIPRVVEKLVRNAERLGMWWREALVQPLEEMGLTANADLSRFTGRIRDVDVEVSEQRSRRGGWHARIHATSSPPLPDGTMITPPREGTRGATLDDVVLDGRLAIEGDVETLEDLLSRDTVRGPLLQVLYVHHGRVTSTAVVGYTKRATDHDGVSAAMTDVCDLVLALREASRR